MSQNAATQDEPGSHRRIVRTSLVAVSAAALLALSAPAVGQAHSKVWCTGKSSLYKPAGTGSGRRIR